MLVLLALAAGTATGYARRGRLRQLTVDPPSRSRLVLTALGIYALGVAGGWAWQPLLPTLTALCWLVLGYYAWLNRRWHGAQLLALGLAANGLAILINGAMPVSASAEARAGVDLGATMTDQAIATSDSTAPWLGKVIPVAFPPRPEVVSPGDIAIAAGSAAVLASAMTSRRSKSLGQTRSEHTVARLAIGARPLARQRTLPSPDPGVDTPSNVDAQPNGVRTAADLVSDHQPEVAGTESASDLEPPSPRVTAWP